MECFHHLLLSNICLFYLSCTAEEYIKDNVKSVDHSVHFKHIPGNKAKLLETQRIKNTVYILLCHQILLNNFYSIVGTINNQNMYLNVIGVCDEILNYYNLLQYSLE